MENLKQKEKLAKEAQEKENQLANKFDRFLWLKAIFGSFLFLGSSVSIYFLFKYKKHFMSK